MPDSDAYFAALPVVEEAIHWYGTNPQAEASPAEVIVSALQTAGLLTAAPATTASGETGASGA